MVDLLNADVAGPAVRRPRWSIYAASLAVPDSAEMGFYAKVVGPAYLMGYFYLS
jgi:hypothetical protein